MAWQGRQSVSNRRYEARFVDQRRRGDFFLVVFHSSASLNYFDDGPPMEFCDALPYPSAIC